MGYGLLPAALITGAVCGAVVFAFVTFYRLATEVERAARASDRDEQELIEYFKATKAIFEEYYARQGALTSVIS